MVAGRERMFPVRRLAANGLEAWAQVLERGCEGYVAKDEASLYVGGKTMSWLEPVRVEKNLDCGGFHASSNDIMGNMAATAE